MAGHISQTDGGDHKNNGHTRGDLGQKTAGAGRPEKGLAGAPSESSANISPLASLEQDDQDQKKTNQNMDNRYNQRHSSAASQYFLLYRKL
jgi:hypothetical protein